MHSKAFKVNAVDYLVKPVETERLQQAMTRVREHVTLHVQASQSERIPVEKGGKKILIRIDSIRFVMARDDYAYLQTDNDRYFSTVSARSAGKAPGRPRVLPRASRLLGEPFACRRGRARSRRHAAFVAECNRRENPCFSPPRFLAEKGVGAVEYSKNELRKARFGEPFFICAILLVARYACELLQCRA